MPASSPVWHPFTQMKTFEGFPMVKSAKGSVLYLEDGKELIDAISSWWVITHGHCDDAIVEAIREQVGRLDQVIFAGFTHEKAEVLCEELVAMTPEPLKHIFFSDDGSTAVEVALKMALQACIQNGKTKRRKFLAFSHAYHGDTVGAMSVGADDAFTAPFKDMMFQVLRAKHPTSVKEPLEAWLVDFKAKLDEYGDQLAGVIVEPLVQGAGGMIMWPEEAVREIVRFSKEAGAYVIFDEVMTGFGRTGAMFAMDKLGVCPDLVASSKGLTAGMLPMSVTMATDEIYQSFLSKDRLKTFFHGHSFTANPVACAAAVANLEQLRKKDMPAIWGNIEAIHHERVARLPHPEIISETRICGTIAAVELKNQTAADYFAPVGPDMYEAAQKKGVLLRPLGNVIYILPPYCITDDQLHKSWDAIDYCIESVLHHYQ